MISFRRQQKNLHEEIRLYGHSDDFEPTKTPQPTTAMKGTIERLECYRLRVLNGEELFHPDDEPLATLDGWVECVAFCKASIEATKQAKREAALEQARNRNPRQQAKNKWNQTYRRRTSKNPTPSRYAKHPDVLES